MFPKTYTSKRRSLISNCIGRYNYYKHGPLARVELGNDKVQGIDYAYTLQGWIKGVNSETLDSIRDMGRDGDTTAANLNRFFAKDVFGYTLNYFTGDYSAITASNFIAGKNNLSNLSADAPGLYNGNISSMVTAITNPTTGKAWPQLTAYHYDQLNRITQMKAFDSINFTSNAWVGTNYTGKYFNSFTYDPNGNIETATAYNRAGVAIDNQDYRYQTRSGHKVSNRLYAINDSATTTSGNDLLNQLAFDTTTATINTVNNYSYDEIGELKSNKQDSIDEIKWTVYGKIKSVTRTPGCHKYNLKFDYSPDGNRIAKHVYKSDNTWVSSEYYVKDAQGNLMTAYKYTYDDVMQTSSFKLTEQHIYGSSAVGIDRTEIELIAAPPAGSVFTHVLGNKQYSGSNHLGNTLAAFTDRKIQHSDGNGNVAYFTSEIVESNDYSAFGGLLTERTFNKGEFPNSFNGKRDDPEMGDWQDYGKRMYSPWMRRFATVDRLSDDYPWFTPFQFAGNSPIAFTDLEGAEPQWFVDIAKLFGYDVAINQTHYDDVAKEAEYQSNMANRRKAFENVSNDMQKIYDAQKSAFSLIPGMSSIYSIFENKYGEAVSYAVFDILGAGLIDGGNILLKNIGINLPATTKTLKAAFNGEGENVLKGIVKKTENLADHLDAKHILAAAGDILGNAIKIGEKEYDHLSEVKYALKGLGNRIEELNKAIKSGTLTDDVLKEAERIRSGLQKQKDKIQNILNKAEKHAKNLEQGAAK